MTEARQACAPASCHPTPEVYTHSAVAVGGRGSLASPVEPRLSEVPLDSGDVPVGGLRPY